MITIYYYPGDNILDCQSTKSPKLSSNSNSEQEMVDDDNIRTLYRSNSNKLSITAVFIDELSQNNHVKAQVNNTNITKSSRSESTKLLKHNKKFRALYLAPIQEFVNAEYKYKGEV